MSQDNNKFKIVYRDRNFHSVKTSRQEKIPRYPNLSSVGGITGEPGFEGNIILNRSDATFYGHNGTEWKSFDSNGDVTLSGVAGVGNLVADGVGPNLAVKTLVEGEGITFTTNPTTVTLDVISKKFDSYYDTGGAQVVVPATFIDVPLHVNRTLDASFFTHTPGSPDVVVLTTDTYLVTGRVTLVKSASNSRSDGDMQLTLNGVAIPGTAGLTYNRNLASPGTTATVSLILSITAGDIIRLQARRLGATTLQILDEGASLTITKV